MGKQSWNHVNGTTPVGIRSYTFSYDGLSRIKTAAYTGQGNESFGIPNIDYDRNGNITQLQRNGKTGGSFGLMDNLTYSYTGNRLTSVNDAVSGNYEVDFVKRGSGGYTYQVNGALKTDENEEITNIVYNTYLNLPEEITLTGGRWIKYTYDGEGKLLKTEYSTGEYWEYVDEFVFKNGQPYQAAIADGRARYESGNWVNEFDYKDHLGNTRVSFKEGTGGAELTARTDFDPWGVRLNGTGTVNSFQNRFELQGHEKESTFNLNRVDFGARVYNPTIGRFDKPDRYSEKYMPLSTYQYAANNPIRYVDINGDSLWVNVTKTVQNDDGTSSLQTNRYYYGQDANGTNGFIDPSNGTLYSGNDSFIGQVSDALGTLMSQNAGNALVTNLASSTENVQIVQSNGNNSAAQDGSFVRWNPNNQGVAGNIRPSFIGLGHELAHVQDSWNKTLNNSSWFSVNNTSVPKSEIYATFIENKIRAEHNVSLRRNYAFDPLGNPQGQSILFKNSRQSRYYDSGGNHNVNYKPIKRRKQTPFTF